MTTGGERISATGLVPFTPFSASAAVGAISTTFSVANGVLLWNNTAFSGGSALYCLMGSTIEAVFDGQVPASCSPGVLEVILANRDSCAGYTISTASSTFTGGTATGTVAEGPGTTTGSTGQTSPYPTPGVVQGSMASAFPVGGYFSSPGLRVLSDQSSTTTSLEACTDYCANYAYFSVSGGGPKRIDLCVGCANWLPQATSVLVGMS